MHLYSFRPTYTNVSLFKVLYIVVRFVFHEFLGDVIFSEQRYHAYFMEDLKSWMVISAGLSYIYVFLLCGYGLLHLSRHSMWWYSQYRACVEVCV